MLKLLIFCFVAILAVSKGILETTRCVQNTWPATCLPTSAPVCGIFKNGNTKDFLNPCTACSNPNVTSFASGTCVNLGTSSVTPTFSAAALMSSPSKQDSPSNNATQPDSKASTANAVPDSLQSIVNCKLLKPEDCKNDSAVCAILESGQTVTSRSNCEACNNPKVLLFTKGACPGSMPTNSVVASVQPNPTAQPLMPNPLPMPQSNTIMTPILMLSAPQVNPLSTIAFPCSSAARSPTCISDGVPVCGQTSEGQQRPYTNLCAACQDPAILTYLQASCSVPIIPSLVSTSTNSTATSSTLSVPVITPPSAMLSPATPPTTPTPTSPIEKAQSGVIVPSSPNVNQPGAPQPTIDISSPFDFSGSFDSGQPAPPPPSAPENLSTVQTTPKLNNQTQTPTQPSVGPPNGTTTTTTTVVTTTIAPPKPSPQPVSVVSSPSSGTTPNVLSCNPIMRVQCKPDKVAVCGRSATNKYTNFLNYCVACADPNVVDFTKTLCPDFSMINSSSVSKNTPTTFITTNNGQLPTTLPGPPNFVPTPLNFSGPATMLKLPNMTVTGTSPNLQNVSTLNPTISTSTPSPPVNTPPKPVQTPPVLAPPIRAPLASAPPVPAPPVPAPTNPPQINNIPIPVQTNKSTVTTTQMKQAAATTPASTVPQPIGAITFLPIIPCTPDFRSRCVVDGVPVCGYFGNNKFANFPNSCMACAESNVLTFQSTSCDKSVFQRQLSDSAINTKPVNNAPPTPPPLQIAPLQQSNQAGSPPPAQSIPIYCQSFQRVPATCISKPYMVCAYPSTGVPRTYSNICNACIEPTVIAYTMGACQEKLITSAFASTNVKNCVLPRKPVYACTLESAPVCGLVISGISKTFLNPCLACSDTSISTYAVSACLGTSITPRDIILNTG